MDIILRNFFRLLRAGIFGEEQTIEPMSPWKWHRAYQVAQTHEVAPLLSDGIDRCQSQFFMQLPDALREHWLTTTAEVARQNQLATTRLGQLLAIYTQQQLRPIVLGSQSIAALYDNPLRRPTPSIDIFLPFDTQGRKADQWAQANGTPRAVSERHAYAFLWQDVSVTHHHRLARLTNALHNRTLNTICEQEIRESPPSRMMLAGRQAEVLSPTLSMLLVLVSMAQTLLRNGISVKQLADLAIMLRKQGDKTDFVKLQEWTDRLHMARMAQLCGELLVALMGLDADEIPFMPGTARTNIDEVLRDIASQQPTAASDWYFQQAGDIFVHTANSSAMMRQLRHSARYSRYYPSESITNFFASLAHSLSHIEE